MIARPTIDRCSPWLPSLACAGLLLSGCAQDVLRALTNNTDEFTQSTAAKVDILWVVDNSESMAANQAGIGESFDAFITNLVTSGVDYHIGVISTDTAAGGRLHTVAGTPPIVEASTADPKAAFLVNVKVGTSGSRRERGFETASMALGKGPSWNPSIPDPVPVPNVGFLRRGYCQADGTCEGTSDPCDANDKCNRAALFLIFVSDEDDKSFGPVKYYWRLFESYYGPGNEALIKVAAIVGPAGNATTNDPGGCFREGRGSAEPGTRYVELVTQAAGANTAEGVVTSICDDFTQALATLSITAAGLSSKFVLSKPANPNARIDCPTTGKVAFCVQVNGVSIPEDTQNRRNGWTFDPGENAIIFGVNALPLAQAKITVSYQELRAQGSQP
ncbi:MAG: hypothetical protein HY903_10035 [Deltaproteobacteria bacterium]|nr:hypothetical protein [Deltaproteobacteria bacterium]